MRPNTPHIEPRRDDAPRPDHVARWSEVEFRVLLGEGPFFDRPARALEYYEVQVAGDRTIRQVIETIGGGPGCTIVQFAVGADGRLLREWDGAYDRAVTTRIVASFGWGTGDQQEPIYLMLVPPSG